MIGDIVGYCIISSNAKTHKSFIGDSCRVMEFSKYDGGALVMNREGNELAMVEKIDIVSQFECFQQGEIIMPVDIKDDFLKQMLYTYKIMNRKGGYHPILKQMVIAASLRCGKFNDNFLWTKQ